MEVEMKLSRTKRPMGKGTTEGNIEGRGPVVFHILVR